MSRSPIPAASVLLFFIAAPGCANPAGRGELAEPGDAGGDAGAALVSGSDGDGAAGGDDGARSDGGDGGDGGSFFSRGTSAAGGADSGAAGGAVTPAGGAAGAVGNGGEVVASQAGAPVGGTDDGGALAGPLGGTAGQLGCGPASGATVSVAGAAGAVARGAGGQGGDGGSAGREALGGAVGIAGAGGAGATSQTGAAGASGALSLAGAAGAAGAGSVAAWPCGEPLLDARDSKSYPTRALGGLCWLGKNLDIGERIDTSLAQSATDRIQKYCFGDDEAMCARFGGLYQWDHAMQSTEVEGATGICPAGWRIPTDREWKALEIAAGMDPAVADLDGWRGDGVGTALKEEGSSGFEAPLGGMVVYGSSYNYPGYGYHWTSTLGTSGPWRRCFTAESTYPPDTVGRWQTWGRQYALPIRCVTDLGT